MKRAEAAIVERRAALRAAEIDLARTDIVSPIDGIIVERNLAVGQSVATGSKVPLFRIAPDFAVIHIDADAGGKGLREAKPGDVARFTVESVPNRSFAGEVAPIRPPARMAEPGAADDGAIIAPDPDFLLEPGMTAAIRIVTGRREDVLRAPMEALLYAPGGPGMQNSGAGPKGAPDGAPRIRILRDGKPMAISVELGLDDGAYVEIVEGELHSGEEAIIGKAGPPPRAAGSFGAAVEALFRAAGR